MTNQNFDDNNPLVSVIIPVYNRSHLLLKTLNSVYKQSYRPIELIIVNDGSTDSPEKVITNWIKQKEEKGFSIHFIQQQNSGAPAARNNGMRYSKGKYLQFLDSDDYLDNQKISKQVESLKHKKDKVAICNFIWVDENGKVISKPNNSGNLWLKLAKGGSIFTATPLIHRSFFEKGLHWDESLKRNQDIDFFLKLLLMTRSYVYLPYDWCFYVHHSGLQISDSYKATKPEFKKRLVGLLKFVCRQLFNLPIKNAYYFFISFIDLFIDWIKNINWIKKLYYKTLKLKKTL